LSEFNASGIAAGIEGRNCRNMESGQHKYICPWNGDLPVYAINLGHLRNSVFFKRHNRWQHLTNFYNNSKFILPEYHSAGTASNVE
jgi:hypothetical protein